MNLSLKPIRGIDQSKNWLGKRNRSLEQQQNSFLQEWTRTQTKEATGPDTTLTALRSESNGRLGDSVKDYFLYFSVGFNIGERRGSYAYKKRNLADIDHS